MRQSPATRGGRERKGVVSVSYRLDRDLICVTAEGTYASKAFLAAVEAALADPASKAPTYLLCDVSHSDSLVERSVDEVRESAEFYGTLLDRVQALAIVAERLVDYGLMRMLASMAEIRGCRVEVFRDTPSARAWLTSLSGGSGEQVGRSRDATG